MLSKFVKLALFLTGIAFFMSASWAVLDTTFHATSDHEFCSSCHSHEPLGTSYRASLHGGNNDSGWRATCSDCHIDQSNSLAYLWVKGTHGVVDPTMELLMEPLDIDWHGHREKRESYVYDSGCLGCHKYLEETTQSNRKAFLAHRKYFSQTTDKKCVSCHSSVGHDELGNHLRAQGWEAAL